MSFANPWGLLGLLSLPVIVVLHLYQRRFPQMAVAGVHLWGVPVDSRDAGPKRQRLPMTASLLLELFAALLLTLLISRPRLDTAQKAVHLVVVLDDSASMSAEPNGETALRTRAIDALQQRLNELPDGSRLTLLLTGRRPVLLAGPAASPQDALQALQTWKPQQPQHSFEPAWDYALQLAAENDHLLFITDTIPEETSAAPKRMAMVSVGQRATNVGITTARWTLTPVSTPENEQVAGIVGTVFLWVENFSTTETTADVYGLSRDEQEVFRRRMSLGAGEGRGMTAAVPGGLGELTVRVEAPNDHLSLDNDVTLVEPQLRPVKVAVTLSPESAAFRQVDSVLTLLPGVNDVPAESADLIIAKATPLPESREGLWWLGVGPLDRSEQARRNATTPTDEFPVIIERSHPLLQNVRLQGVRWSGVQPLNLDVVPLMSAGGHVLFGRLKGTATRAFILNVNLERSSLSKSPDWPIFLHNLIESRRTALPGLRKWNYRSGETVAFRLPRKFLEGQKAGSPRNGRITGAPLRLVRGDEERPVARTSQVEFTAPVAPGVYELRDEEERIGHIAVALQDARESDLTRLKRGEHVAADKTQTSESGFLIDKPFSAVLVGLLLLVLAALACDWYVLEPKRRT